MVNLDNLKEHPRNPNTHSPKQIRLLAKIIKHQGWRNSIIVSNRSGFIVSGHGRLQAAKKLGAKEVPVDFQDFDNVKDELSYLVADNRIAELAEIDRSELADIIGDIDSGDFDLELTGFELDSVEELMTAAPPPDLEDDEDGKSKRCPNCGEMIK
jgi:ParB-like chromosome segregation protein Spo0J